ncbi:VOC family protein [Iamia sp.]|uniref:VOC family protein n=1 Tax=Iamia sp. TaxID=2722710 RepID=UPI002B966287|nr:VOC family protein [Iamia sp.]HXH58424.1 VOC family protein [Iamia sp.]
MARLADVVFDCRHPASLARFWAAALDGYSVAPYDEAELARLGALDIDDPEDDPTVLVESPGATPRFWFQRVPEEKVVKNRVHLDLRCDDPDGEAQRLMALGAQLAPEQPNPDLIVLHDLEGNELCLLR